MDDKQKDRLRIAYALIRARADLDGIDGHDYEVESDDDDYVGQILLTLRQ